jgi:hypothetical protein
LGGTPDTFARRDLHDAYLPLGRRQSQKQIGVPLQQPPSLLALRHTFAQVLAVRRGEIQAGQNVQYRADVAQNVRLRPAQRRQAKRGQPLLQGPDVMPA